MERAKTSRGQNESLHAQEREHARNRITLQKFLEVAFWGTVFWGIIRLVIHFLNFTPYGLASYGRPFLGIAGEKTYAGTALGFLVLFTGTLVASFIYRLVFSRTRNWWSGLVLGAVVGAAIGFFFRFEKWELSTLSTEAAWFLSYGLFIGMTLTLESSDQ